VSCTAVQDLKDVFDLLLGYEYFSSLSLLHYELDEFDFAHAIRKMSELVDLTTRPVQLGRNDAAADIKSLSLLSFYVLQNKKEILAVLLIVIHSSLYFRVI
jgi:hypothetical protein